MRASASPARPAAMPTMSGADAGIKAIADSLEF